MSENICKRFKVEATLKFGENSYLYVEGALSVGSMKLYPLDPTQKEAGIKISFEVEGSDKREATSKGLTILKKLALILCCKTNIGIKIEDFNVVELPTVKVSKGGRNIVVEAHEVINIIERVRVGLGISEKTLSNVLEVANRDLPPYVWRFLEWYNYAILEYDAANRFVMLWTAMEAWKTHLLGPSIHQTHEQKMRETLEKYGYRGDFDEIYNLRNRVFHEGVREEEIVEYVQQLLQCAERIIDEIKETYAIS